MNIIDKIFKKYHKTVNMSFSELKMWKATELSKSVRTTKASINRNLRLLATPKKKWKVREVRNAISTLKNIKRLKKLKKGKVISNNLSLRDIKLKNWGFNIRK